MCSLKLKTGKFNFDFKFNKLPGINRYVSIYNIFFATIDSSLVLEIKTFQIGK